MIDTPFTPPWLLRGGHAQTLLASAPTRNVAIRARAVDLLGESERLTLRARNGAILHAWYATGEVRRPLVIIVHGWLGSHEASYVLSSGSALWAAGFDVARLNLRDHGGTDHLNEEMFNSARIEEVVDAVEQLIALHGNGPVGVLGFSLGGNFALRIGVAASRQDLPVGAVLAVCPLVDPASSIACIDRGMPVYRAYFMRKWHAALDAKKAAFPALYDFTHTYALRGVGSTTDYFVREHTEFGTPREYFAHYTLTGDALADLAMPTRILAAKDDPVIPAGDFERIAPTSQLTIQLTSTGGHCAYIEDLASACYADRYAVDWFRRWQDQG